MFDFEKFTEKFFGNGYQGYQNGAAKRSSSKRSRKFGKMSFTKSLVISLVITFIVGFVSFYVSLPALNFQDTQFYSYLFFVLIVFFICFYFLYGGNVSGDKKTVKKNIKLVAGVFGVIIVIFVVGQLTSAKIFNAKRYSSILDVQPGNFTEDVEEITFDQIPVLDKDSAERLGDRKLGELSDMVSQFEVADDYVQINYKGRPVRVTPLEYGDLIKWFNNRSEGLPAYLVIDMVTQEVDVVRLDEGMKYTTAEHFGRKLERHLRFTYPTYIFDTPTFEIDENGDPYWICPRLVKRIGLFGGTDVAGAVIVNAITGESTYYEMENIPSWVDRVASGELLIQQYDYYGEYTNGYWNSIFGQKGVTQTTSGYNYIAVNDDVYVYTGVTSVGKDQSNIGFLLVNQRTKEAKYYQMSGAEEYSAQSSAEGVVQHLNYKATFPILLNISGQPTYFMSLKDNAGLVKQYAMVNMQQYQIVATGATIMECENKYETMLAENNIEDDQNNNSDTAEQTERLNVSGIISDIRTAVIEGNTYYYIKLDDNDIYFSVSAAQHEEVIILNPGDQIEIEYAKSSKSIIPVLSIKH